MPPPRLAIVIPNLVRGGTERHLLMLLPELARHGFDVTLLVLHGGGVLERDFAAQGIMIRNADRGWGNLSAWFFLWRQFRSLRPRIAHFFLPEAYIFGATAALAAGCGTRIMSRRSLNDYQSRRRLAGRFERLLHPFMTVIAANSRRVYQQLASEERVPAPRLKLIYNGIDTTPLESPTRREAIRRELAIDPGALVLIDVANLIFYKGHADLLTALGLVENRLPPGWRLLCVGRDDGIGAELGALAERLEIAGHIVWLGERSDVAELIGAADIALSASHEEGFSNAVLEAMAASLPVIATAVGGNVEAVIDGETGILVPPRDPAMLGDAIANLAAEPDRRGAMGLAGRARVVENFSLAACVDAYVALYRGAIGLSQSP